MSITVRIIHSDGEAKLTEPCLRSLGKSSWRMEELGSVHEIVSPTSVVFTQIRSLGLLNPELATKVLDDVLTLPIFKPVSTSAKEILNTRDCAFDVETYSLNEVVFAMFWLRAFLHQQVLTCLDGRLGYDMGINAVTELMRLTGCTWQEAFILALMPGFSATSYSSAHRKGEDASLMTYSGASLKKLVLMLHGKWTPELDQRKFRDHIVSCSPYPTNIQSRLYCREDRTVLDLVKHLNTIYRKYRQPSQAVDLFGIPFPSASSVDDFYIQAINHIRKEVSCLI